MLLMAITREAGRRSLSSLFCTLALASMIGAGFASLVDCGPQCQVGAEKCDGNTFMWCNTGDISGPYWDSIPCPVACNSQAGGCVDSPQPISECAQDGRACWNNAVTYCQHGYPAATTPCASGETCVSGLVSGLGCAYCAPGIATPDARCPTTRQTGAFCVGNTIYQCDCGDVVQGTVCQAPTPNCLVSVDLVDASCVQ